MIRVAIVDDQRLMREGLQTLLSLESDLTVVWIAEDGAKALQITERTTVDVVLMDIRMPIMSGIEATQEITRKHPDIKVLMLTTFEEQADVVNALAAGAVGYLLKDMPSEQVAEAIRVAFAGGAILPPSVAKTFLTAVHLQEQRPGADNGAPQAWKESLTDRELDVLHCLAKGMSNREIGEALCVTEGTVKNHVSNLIAKLELRDRTQAALFAVRQGFGLHS